MLLLLKKVGLSKKQAQAVVAALEQQNKRLNEQQAEQLKKNIEKLAVFSEETTIKQKEKLRLAIELLFPKPKEPVKLKELSDEEFKRELTKEVLCFDGVMLTEVQIRTLALAIGTKKIQPVSLYLCGNPLDDKIMEHLARAIYHCESLVHLVLSYCALSDHSVGLLAYALQGCPRLLSLDLSDNHITCGTNTLSKEGIREFSGIVALGKALQSNKTLLYLNIGFNPIIDEGFTSFAKYIQQNKTLLSIWTTLHLDFRNGQQGQDANHIICKVTEGNRKRFEEEILPNLTLLEKITVPGSLIQELESLRTQYSSPISLSSSPLLYIAAQQKKLRQEALPKEESAENTVGKSLLLAYKGKTERNETPVKVIDNHEQKSSATFLPSPEKRSP